MNFDNSLTEVSLLNFSYLLFSNQIIVSEELPGINLSHHCGFAANRQYPFLYKCSLIERYIKECQRNGIKVTISIGGSTGKGDLGSADRALKLAYNLWNLYLGGEDTLLTPLRPFGRRV